MNNRRHGVLIGLAVSDALGAAGHRETFLKKLVFAHSDGDELALATRIAERTTWRDQTVEDLAKSLMPLHQSLARDEISERKMAQASGKWVVTV